MDPTPPAERALRQRASQTHIGWLQYLHHLGAKFLVIKDFAELAKNRELESYIFGTYPVVKLEKGKYGIFDLDASSVTEVSPKKEVPMAEK